MPDGNEAYHFCYGAVADLIQLTKKQRALELVLARRIRD